jgi:hypothetical protein
MTSFSSKWIFSHSTWYKNPQSRHRWVDGQLQRTKKPQQIRGLNRNHNHEMKEIFKGAATRASCGIGPLRDFYVALLAKGMKPEMARLTLARKIAAIALRTFRHRTTEATSSLSVARTQGICQVFMPRWWPIGSAMLGFEGEYPCTH